MYAHAAGDGAPPTPGSAGARRRVLILTRELVAAGLLGALAEQAGCAPLFGERGEQGESALRRLRPDLVLLDAFHPAAVAPRLYAAAHRAGVRVVVFSATPPWDDLRRIAAVHDGVSFVAPGEHETLADCLLRALTG